MMLVCYPPLPQALFSFLGSRFVVMYTSSIESYVTISCFIEMAGRLIVQLG